MRLAPPLRLRDCVAQVNDTDIHQPFERLHLKFKQAAFTEQQVFEPGNINRTPQDVPNDVAATWRRVDHTVGVRGRWKTGLSNSLRGDEDHLITREARDCWLVADMAPATG